MSNDIIMSNPGISREVVNRIFSLAIADVHKRRPHRKKIYAPFYRKGLKYCERCAVFVGFRPEEQGHRCPICGGVLRANLRRGRGPNYWKYVKFVDADENLKDEEQEVSQLASGEQVQ